MALPLNLELVSTLGSHCVRRSVEQLQQAGAAWQQAVQPLPLGFPPGPEGDVAFELAQEPLECLESLQSRYGGLVGFKLASRSIVLVSSPSVLLHTPICFLHRLLQTPVGAVRLQLLGNGIWMHFLLTGSWEHTVIILELTKAMLNTMYMRLGKTQGMHNMGKVGKRRELQGRNMRVEVGTY